MKPMPKQRGGLADAHDRIAGLLDDLNETVDLVQRLTRVGNHEGAIRLVDEQRSALFAAIEEVSQDVARPQRWWESARRNATALVAAFALILSSVAVAAGLRDATEPTLIEKANASIAEASEISDPAMRLQIIERVVQITRELPPSAEKTKLASDLGPLLEDTKGKAEEEGNDELLVKVDELQREVEGTGSNPPNSPPSTGQTPVQDVGSQIDDVAPDE